MLRVLLPWIVAAACFAVVYSRLERAAAAEGSSLPAYLWQVLTTVSWGPWLALMIAYCLLYLVVDAAVVWRVVTWFNAPLGYPETVRVRGSAYVLSMVNEPIGKGGMALYLNRRHGVPGQEAASSMLFLMFCEYYSLLLWATVGVTLRWSEMPPVLHLVPWLAAASVVFFVAFRHVVGRRRTADAPGRSGLLLTFRRARLPQYVVVVAARSALVLAAVGVYTVAARLFGVGVSFVEMLGLLPVILFGAAVPGSMRSVAILLWVTLFPENPGEIAAFGFFQHNFFVLFTALIGLVFLRRVSAGLFREVP